MSKERDPYFDNLKGILIILVCAGHCLNIYRDTNPYCNYLFHLIYAFHMPLFFFVSGYFSKNYDKSYKTAFENLIIPAIPFEILYYLMHVATKAENTQPLLTPIFAYWFLFALFGCKVMLPYLIKIRWIVPVTFILALAAGFNQHINEYMTLSRFLCMLPFFLLGYYATEENISKIRGMNKALCARLGILAALAVFFALKYSGIDLGFTLRSPYADARGVAARGFQFLIVLPLSIALMRFTPAADSLLAKIGQRTLQIYFLNFYFVTLIKMFNPLASNMILNTAVMLIAAVIMSLIIASDIVSRCYDAFIGMTKKILMREA